MTLATLLHRHTPAVATGCACCHESDQLMKCANCPNLACAGCLHHCDICTLSLVCEDCYEAMKSTTRLEAICRKCGEAIAEHFAKRTGAAA